MVNSHSLSLCGFITVKCSGDLESKVKSYVCHNFFNIRKNYILVSPCIKIFMVNLGCLTIYTNVMDY